MILGFLKILFQLQCTFLTGPDRFCVQLHDDYTQRYEIFADVSDDLTAVAGFGAFRGLWSTERK